MSTYCYTYSKYNDFPGAVNFTTLNSEIVAETRIHCTIRELSSMGESVYIILDCVLSNDEVGYLNAVVAAHNPGV
jgi:hypothetical protein